MVAVCDVPTGAIHSIGVERADAIGIESADAVRAIGIQTAETVGIQTAGTVGTIRVRSAGTIGIERAEPVRPVGIRTSGDVHVRHVPFAGRGETNHNVSRARDRRRRGSVLLDPGDGGMVGERFAGSIEGHRREGPAATRQRIEIGAIARECRQIGRKAPVIQAE